MRELALAAGQARSRRGLLGRVRVRDRVGVRARVRLGVGVRVRVGVGFRVRVGVRVRAMG